MLPYHGSSLQLTDKACSKESIHFCSKSLTILFISKYSDQLTNWAYTTATKPANIILWVWYLN